MRYFSGLSVAMGALLMSTPSHGQSAPAAVAAPRPVAVSVDATKTVGALPPSWRFFGADEPNYATMKDGEKLLVQLGDLRRGEVYFRAHNLLNTGDGTPAFKWGSTNIYREAKDGKPIYDWTNVDRIIDTYIARGVKPYLQIGFMPEAMSTAPAGTRTGTTGVRASTINTSSPAGPIRPRIMTSGASWSINGPATMSNAMAVPRSNAGISRSGTNRTEPIGRARRRSSTSCTTMPSMAFAARCPRRGSAAWIRRAPVAASWTASCAM